MSVLLRRGVLAAVLLSVASLFLVGRVALGQPEGQLTDWPIAKLHNLHEHTPYAGSWQPPVQLQLPTGEAPRLRDRNRAVKQNLHRAVKQKLPVASNDRAHATYQENQMLFVTEVIPRESDGGGMRAREVLCLTAQTFDAQPWIVARWPYMVTAQDNLFDDLGARILVDSPSPKAIAGAATPRIFGTGFKALTGTGDSITNFSALVEHVTTKVGGVAPDGVEHRGDGEAPNVRLALLFMWSFHIAPSGDVHWTIPELYLPLVRTHLPGACAVIVADDLQHVRFRIEARLTAESADRLAEREMMAYLQADGVFFVSREDRDEAERQLRRRRAAEASTAPLPLLLTLPYVGEWRRNAIALSAEGRASSDEWPLLRPMPSHNQTLLLFIGSATRSNEVAVSWLIHKVLPLLREADPTLELTLVGKRRRRYLLPGVRTLGFVDDLHALVANASVLLLPSFVQSGVATKVLLGIHSQVPVVTTSTGRRGIWYANDTLPPECLEGAHPIEGPLITRDRPAEYAAATLALLNDRDMYISVQRCLRTFGAGLGAAQQQRAMERMRDHCRKRDDGGRGQLSQLEGNRTATVEGDAASAEEAEHNLARLLYHHPLLAAQRYAPSPLVAARDADDASDAPMRLAKHAAWRGAVGQRRALDLTVLTSIVAKDSEFVDAWLLDISRQEALDVYVVEVVVGCFEEAAYDAVVAAVGRRLAELGKLARLSVCLFRSDPGIYGMWDAIIKRQACAPIVTNWNVDDRKSPTSLLKRMNALADREVSAVTSDVLLFNDSNYTWADRESTYTLQLFDLGESRRLRIDDMFVFHWNNSVPFIHGSRNVPHNSPMWRRSMHLLIGGFDAEDGLGCYDFSFWLRVLRGGFHIWHLNEPLEMYLSRATSHGHRTHAWESPRWGDRWANECDSLADWELNAAAAVRQVKRPSRGPRYPQTFADLRSPKGEWLLYIQHANRICIAPYSDALRARVRAVQRRLAVELVFNGRIRSTGGDWVRSRRLCMHHVERPWNGSHKALWCKWTCTGCELKLSDEGRFYWTNGTRLHGANSTYSQKLFSWTDRGPNRYRLPNANATCWSPPGIVWPQPPMTVRQWTLAFLLKISAAAAPLLLVYTTWRCRPDASFLGRRQA